MPIMSHEKCDKCKYLVYEKTFAVLPWLSDGNWYRLKCTAKKCVKEVKSEKC
jgi:hypothetical protein